MAMVMFLVLLFLIALLLSLIITPLIIMLAKKYGILDKPNERKMHSIPVPLGGGVAIYLSFIITVIVLVIMYPFSGKSCQQFLTGRDIGVLISLFIGGTLTVFLGLIDDIRVMPPKVKLIGQIVIVLIIYALGVRISFVNNLIDGGIYYLPQWLSIVVTILWIVGIMNAVNLLDGLDGLLAGVSTISAIIFMCMSLIKGQILIAMLMAIMAGSALGFLKYNFNPAQLFMGDTGSLFLGIMFASMSTIGALKSTTTVALFVPVFIMGLPIIDTIWAIVRRARKKQPIFKADKEHLHHKLISLGLSVRQAVVLIYVINICFGLIGLALCHWVR